MWRLTETGRTTIKQGNELPRHNTVLSWIFFLTQYLLHCCGVYVLLSWVIFSPCEFFFSVAYALDECTERRTQSSSDERTSYAGIEVACEPLS